MYGRESSMGNLRESGSDFRSLLLSYKQCILCIMLGLDGMALSNVLGNFQPHSFPKTWVHSVQRIVLVAGAEFKTKVILFGEPSSPIVSHKSLVSVAFAGLELLFRLPSIQPQALQHITSEKLHIGRIPGRDFDLIKAQFGLVMSISRLGLRLVENIVFKLALVFRGVYYDFSVCPIAPSPNLNDLRCLCDFQHAELFQRYWSV